MLVWLTTHVVDDNLCAAVDDTIMDRWLTPTGSDGGIEPRVGGGVRKGLDGGPPTSCNNY